MLPFTKPVVPVTVQAKLTVEREAMLRDRGEASRELSEKTEGAQGMERSLEHRERRLEEERSLMQGQVSLLQVTFHFWFPWTDFWMS